MFLDSPEMLGLSLIPPLSHLCLFALVKVALYTFTSNSHPDPQNVVLECY